MLIRAANQAQAMCYEFSQKVVNFSKSVIDKTISVAKRAFEYLSKIRTEIYKDFFECMVISIISICVYPNSSKKAMILSFFLGMLNGIRSSVVDAYRERRVVPQEG